jgi:hypothetical protein
VETDALYCNMEAIQFQTFEDGKIHLIGFISRNYLPAEENFNSYATQMLTITHATKIYRCNFKRVLHITTICSSYMNYIYLKETK